MAYADFCNNNSKCKYTLVTTRKILQIIINVIIIINIIIIHECHILRSLILRNDYLIDSLAKLKSPVSMDIKPILKKK